MTDEAIPANVRNLIFQHIDSVAHLEALLLLRANASEHWSAERTAKRLYSSEPELASVLADLTNSGFISVRDEASYQYSCAPELDEAVERLADAYSRQLIAITNLIHSKPRRIRQFADAFKLRKDR